MRFNIHSSTRSILLAFCTALAGGCGDTKAGPVHASVNVPPAAAPGLEVVEAGPGPDQGPALVDEDINARRVALLEVAFEAASSLPSNPHIKTRSNCQADVVRTCLELQQLKRAAAYIERIDNWRRGEGYADLAFLLAQRGQVEAFEPFSKLAEAAARTESEESEKQPGQNWRRDRVLARLASARLLLGDTQAAADLERGLADSEVGRTAGVKAMRIDQGDLEQHLRTLDAIIATGSFDPIRNALESISLLHKRFYSDEATRTRLEEKIKTSWTRLPPSVRVELSIGLADNALQSQDLGHAGALLEASRQLIASFEWTPDQEFPVKARAAVFAHRLGEHQQARAEVDGLLERYDVVRVQFGSADRADALRPIAAAYAELGDEVAARKVYARAIDEGASNPNGRPRVEDLVDTLLSMASKGVLPDSGLTTKITEVRNKLIAPW